MKKTILIILCFVLFQMNHLAQDTMFIHQVGGSVIMLPVNNIDSIVFYGSVMGPTVTDIDGNVYPIVTIGSQEWMGQNLRTTHFNDGSPVTLVTDASLWITLTTSAYCWYNNDEITHKSDYGALYNWYAAEDANLCPEGWHVPTDSEWTTLIDYIGGENTAGGKLKEVGTSHWNSPNTGATDVFNYTALPGGKRGGSGEYNSIRETGYWWSVTEAYPSSAWYRYMIKSSAKTSRHHLGKIHGFSVRCLKD